jgi:hypothetical protein
MTGIAFCRKPPPALARSKLMRWALGGSDRRWQDKANWRSQTRRSSAIAKPLSAHWFFKNAMTGAQTTFSPGRLAPFKLSEQFQYASRWRSRTSF